MNDYKPCPHCNNDQLVFDANKTSDNKWLFAAKCPKCNSMTWEINEELEVAKITVHECWNNRATEVGK